MDTLWNTGLILLSQWQYHSTLKCVNFEVLIHCNRIKSRVIIWEALPLPFLLGPAIIWLKILSNLATEQLYQLYRHNFFLSMDTHISRSMDAPNCPSMDAIICPSMEAFICPSMEALFAFPWTTYSGPSMDYQQKLSMEVHPFCFISMPFFFLSLSVLKRMSTFRLKRA
jgi:hypothetical protein